MVLSVIVPVYNMAEDGKLAYCLDSLLAQTISDYEIIAVDDCSTDTSYEILKEYERRYPDKLRALCHDRNKKQGGARNTGLSCARGEWIGFVDSDDWIAPDMYEKLLKKAKETGADVVGCDYTLTSEHSMKTGRTVQNNTMDQTGVLDEEKYAKLLMRSGSMVIKVYRHDVIKEKGLRFPENTFYEDNCAGPLWMLSFKRFEKVEEPLYYYYQHEASTVHSISEERCHNRMDMGRQLVAECRKAGYYDKYPKELEFRFTELFYYNTLFSYVSTTGFVHMSLLKELREGMQQYFPDFRENPYFVQYYDAEQKKLMDYHMKSPLFFLCYYKLLSFYRRLRYRKK